MGWQVGYDWNWRRDIGYGVPAVCDFPRCNEEIDRGLGFVCCDEEPYGGDRGCGLYFCEKHMKGGRCSRCTNYRPPFNAKPDHPDWIAHKLTDESWAAWRAENPEKVAALEVEKGTPR
jgi:hypothetical protein